MLDDAHAILQLGANIIVAVTSYVRLLFATIPNVLSKLASLLAITMCVVTVNVNY